MVVNYFMTTIQYILKIHLRDGHDVAEQNNLTMKMTNASHHVHNLPRLNSYCQMETEIFHDTFVV